MFKKLRNKFMIINMISITSIMIICFFVIYTITYRNVYSQIDKEINRIADIREFSPINPQLKHKNPNEIEHFPPPPLYSIPNKILEHISSFNNDKFFNNHSIYFSIDLDNEKNMKSKWTDLINEDENFFNEAIEIILSYKSTSGEFNLDDSYWFYVIKNINNGYKIFVLEITPQKNILTNLIYTFIIVSIIMIFFVCIVCLFFAEWSIRPIKESFEKQRQFVADASHELKTPISVISTNIDVIMSNKTSTIEEQEKWFSYIKLEVSRMSNLINNLLYLAKIDYSETKTIYSKFNLSEEIEKSILSIEAILFEKNIKLNTNIQSNIILNGNKEQIHEVFIILLDNAIKYSDENGTININLNKNGSEIIFSVKNTGVGIDSKYINKIFDRFFRTDSSRTRDTGGYGLGLSIAKAIVTQHGGTIYAESKLNRYAEFFIKFYKS